MFLRHIRCPLFYVLIDISTNASTLSAASGAILPCFATGTVQSVPSYIYIALLSAALLEQHPFHIVRAAVYPLLLSSQHSVDADVGQALFPLHTCT